MNSFKSDENAFGEYTYKNLVREPYWPPEKLRISVTGAGGFIGSHIARRLKSGHYIIASDWKKNEHMTEDMFCHEFHLVDLRVMENFLKVTSSVDHVFNLAADMGGMRFIQSNHSVIMYNNTMISLNMLEAARINGVKSFENKKLPIHHIPGPEGVRGRNSDNSLITEKLGWAPTMGLRDGLSITYSWIKEQVQKEKSQGVDLSAYGSSTVVETQAPVQLGALGGGGADGKESTKRH